MTIRKGFAIQVTDAIGTYFVSGPGFPAVWATKEEAEQLVEQTPGMAGKEPRVVEVNYTYPEVIKPGKERAKAE